MKNKIGSYIIGIALPLGVGTLAAFLTRESMNIYAEITKPPLSPPAILFPIVWTVLYVLMGISSVMIFNSKEANPTAAEKGLKLYILSLILNFSWSIVFFNNRSFGLALVVILILLALIIGTVVNYFKVKPLPAILQIPYAIWVAFATYLNGAILFLN